ncbi:Hypothetical protein CINCED_3A020948 [Cinara cedri]|uniref:Uncharacterized protein n=1 Tax=Cinara cedri TaxID=506608 RepID=A0A5E4MZN5_9HEMI|nr:Hypothetical protein CINCED_3A020948 [Cinara cedri]
MTGLRQNNVIGQNATRCSLLVGRVRHGENNRQNGYDQYDKYKNGARIWISLNPPGYNDEYGYSLIAIIIFVFTGRGIIQMVQSGADRYDGRTVRRGTRRERKRLQTDTAVDGEKN